MSNDLRPVFVLRQVQIPWSELRAGDVFRTAKASHTDVYANENEWNLAMSDAEQEPPPAEWGVAAASVAVTVDEIVNYQLRVPTLKIETARDPWVAPEPTMFGAQVDDGIVTTVRLAFPVKSAGTISQADLEAVEASIGETIANLDSIEPKRDTAGQ